MRTHGAAASCGRQSCWRVWVSLPWDEPLLISSLVWLCRRTLEQRASRTQQYSTAEVSSLGSAPGTGKHSQSVCVAPATPRRVCGAGGVPAVPAPHPAAQTPIQCVQPAPSSGAYPANLLGCFVKTGLGFLNFILLYIAWCDEIVT